MSVTHPGLVPGRGWDAMDGPAGHSQAGVAVEGGPVGRHPFADRRLAAMLGLGFSSGIPFLLIYVTQSAWLSEARIPIATLGLLSELTLAYKFKFVWAPFLDRYDAPLLGRLLGRRRGWIIASQLGVALALAASRSVIRRTGWRGRWRSCWRSASRGRRRTW